MGPESKPQAPPEGVCFVENCVVLFAGGEDPAAGRARMGVLRTWAGREVASAGSFPTSGNSARGRVKEPRPV